MHLNLILFAEQEAVRSNLLFPVPFDHICRLVW